MCTYVEVPRLSLCVSCSLCYHQAERQVGTKLSFFPRSKHQVCADYANLQGMQSS
jgi:hypothetical protein